MLRARAGDAGAYAELYDRWSGPLLRYFFHLSHDREASEDLLQETFLRVWRAAPRYEPRARFSTYLFQCGKNLWINERAKVLRRPLKVSLDAPLDGEEDGPTRVDGIDSGAPLPPEEVVRAETGRRIREAVEGLSDKLREVFVLAGFQELPYRDVAEILGIPEGTVKSRMWAAVRQLRERLGEEP
ncbi:MAG: sigma-70 family RNA polymerase sigma factor [Planctomycetaceae bacterium]|nr:sigma-70 family RNA polymerase sigma factor [Planctomycetota bacterium]NUN53537.1 sigma-70 family RNA polymerase sigma factor [Planctomycetaceae bacterium]